MTTNRGSRGPKNTKFLENRKIPNFPVWNTPCLTFHFLSNTLYEIGKYLENTKFPLLKQTLFDIPGEKFIGVGLDVTATSGKQLFPKKKQNLFTSIRNIHKIYCHNVGQEK